MRRWLFFRRRSSSGAEPVITAATTTNRDAAAHPAAGSAPQKTRPSTLIELISDVLDSSPMTIRFIAIIGFFIILANGLDISSWFSDHAVGEWIGNILPGNYKWLAAIASTGVVGWTESRRRKRRGK